ncbi:MAG: MYXO-CTERM sorting domain-containing protein [Myxococcota bacterium]|nr:MYXO-CTERM sorting domain-containing protein [Myxococcota bacterium]
MQLARLAMPLICVGIAIAPLPSHADVLIGDSGGQEDTGADEDEDDEDKDGCSAAPITPTSALSLGLGLALLGVVRRRQR